MSAIAKSLLLLALLLSTSQAWAQDALGGGAGFDDEWNAILKASPPSVAAADTKRGKSARAEGRASEKAARPSSTAPVSEKSQEASRPGREQRVSEKSREAPRTGREQTERGESKSSAVKSGRSQQEASAPGGEERARASKGGDQEGALGAYAGLVRQWHDPWPAHAGDQAIDLIVGAATALSLHPDGRAGTPYVLLPKGKDGGFDEQQIAVASQAFGGWPGGPQVSERLLDLIYHAAKHFKIFHIHLVSGIRNDRSGSRHSHGLAADIVFPGVSDEELAAYFRPQGFLGVGIYTRAGFVHVDVRERSYFWLDKSLPGRRNKMIPIRGEEARLADENAVRRGQKGYVNPPRLQKALFVRAKHRREAARLAQ